MAHNHLNYLKRCQILALWKAGFNQTQIATEVGVYKSTISREFKRNLTFIRSRLGYWTYKPDYAQVYASDRKKAKRYFYKFTKEVAEFVRSKLEEDWSLEQISGYVNDWVYFQLAMKESINLSLRIKKMEENYISMDQNSPLKVF